MKGNNKLTKEHT